MTVSKAPATAARSAGAGDLAAALQASRADTLATFAVLQAALPQGVVPQRATLNPPLWELGHIGWFQEYWIARNPVRTAGAAAHPQTVRPAGVRHNADALYDSSAVPHASRWSLPLPGAAATRSDLAQQLAGTLACLRQAAAEAPAAAAAPDDAALYFFRLALFHEDMHHEAALYMAQSLGVAIADARWQAAPLPAAGTDLSFEAGAWTLGSAGDGFAFDNELGPHTLQLPATTMARRVTRWAEFLPFIEAGGYAQPQWWSPAGAAWLAAEKAAAPRYLRREGKAWQQWRHGQWGALDLALPACHLTAFEAEAWCRWAGRRLPTEGEWERAAITRPDDFEWGQVWEWTASPFAPYPGFVAHPYRDYSAPWFDGRPVLRGASCMTQPRLRHPRYRNFFQADRNDVPAGLRSCAL
jgi:ergothioneine biosynthesis protein EgtB